MRIRKHAKISPVIYATSFLKPGTVLQTHVCQLNQSPWDVMTFSPPSTPPPPPPPSQVDGDYDCAENGSSGHCISGLESELNNLAHQWEYSDYFTGETTPDDAPPPQPLKDEQIIMCCKTDGKSWQCRREAAKGNSLCEHHLSLVKNYNSLAHHVNKKSEKTSSEPRRRPRPKKASTSSSSNPYEFYYYSGFGPRWGKKRGETCKDTDSIMSQSIGHEHEVDPVPSISDEFDYSEFEDEEEDEDEDRENGKKRVRKPIKARSLKSLM
ncbi:hypothetical protein CDL12_30121 [Handroanthus impetiginosus]|uniref:WRC domain-containing protein n=1 Tax=Handroanthus impetiginosus TaxID=429701 RepID=A0A2G9FXJ9_9LAMI|nr:hypothetical protein CDL12_30121 [Handroanthus impetiginosus]